MITLLVVYPAQTLAAASCSAYVTVRHAMAILRERGVIIPVRGRGDVCLGGTDVMAVGVGIERASDRHSRVRCLSIPRSAVVDADNSQAVMLRKVLEVLQVEGG